MDMKVLVIYDIANNTRREQLAQLLAATGIRLQYSVFECTLRTRTELHRFTQAVTDTTNPTCDRVLIYPFTTKQQVTTIGTPLETPLPNHWIV